MESFDFKNIVIKTIMGREDFIGTEFIPNIKYQSDKFAVIEIPTVLKNGHITTIGGSSFCLTADENSRLHGEPVTGKMDSFIELSLPDGWNIYDANQIGRYTIAVFVEKVFEMEKLEEEQ